jgi:hypothetical protein
MAINSMGAPMTAHHPKLTFATSGFGAGANVCSWRNAAIPLEAQTQKLVASRDDRRSNPKHYR